LPRRRWQVVGQSDITTEQGMKELEFGFDGPQAGADAQALADFFAREFPDWPVRTGSHPPHGKLIYMMTPK